MSAPAASHAVNSPDEDESHREICVDGVELEVAGPSAEVQELAQTLGGGVRVSRPKHADSRSPDGAAEPDRAHLHHFIVAEAMPQQQAIDTLTNWLAQHVEDLERVHAHKAIWVNVDFISNGSQWITLPPELLQLIARAGCGLVNQFVLAISDEDLEALLGRRRSRRQDPDPPSSTV